MSESQEKADAPPSSDAAGASEGVGEDGELPMKDVTDPRETDVLCGRGGAALRHPGNQTYRRLVNLNKGLYITCLKTEKLKISRSIVAAIREQNGRFLERDTAKGTWFDIGDKKAIEKTSQALREGQPKLRQKIVEMGGAPPGAGMTMEHHAAAHVAAAAAAHHHMGGGAAGAAAPPIPGAHFANGIYNPTASGSAAAGGMQGGYDYGGGAGGMMMSQQQQHQMQQQQHPMQQMPPPPSRSSNSNIQGDFSAEMLMRLSITSNDDTNRSIKSRLRPSIGTVGSSVARELGIGESNKSLMSNFSAYTGTGINESFMSVDATGGMRNGMFGSNDNMGFAFGGPSNNSMMMGGSGGDGGGPGSMSHMGGGMGVPPPPAMSPAMTGASPSMRSFDRRRLFAKMKYSRPASGRFSQRSIGTDGMPDIHMVDSNYSLLSGFSGHGDGSKRASADGGGEDGAIDGSNHAMGLGSRRSLMSGLSKISDHSSDVNSIFSDLSRKIGNVSTRSIAMSEISGIEEGFHESLDESFHIDPLPPASDTDGVAEFAG